MANFTTSDGVEIFYRDEGEGVPLVCLAGLTRDGRDFDFVAPHLEGVRLIRPDYRGRGQSGWADWSTYTIPVEGRDTVELLDHLGLKQAAVLGTSRGGLIAMGLAATVKDRLMGVALNDIGPEIADAGLEVIKGYLGRRPPQKTLAEVAARRAELMTGFVGVPESRWLEEAERIFVQEEDGLGLTYDPGLREAVLGGGAQPVADLWPFFDAFKGLPPAGRELRPAVARDLRGDEGAAPGHDRGGGEGAGAHPLPRRTGGAGRAAPLDPDAALIRDWHDRRWMRGLGE